MVTQRRAYVGEGLCVFSMNLTRGDKIYDSRDLACLVHR